MDELDIKILNYLNLNSRATASEISKIINLSVPAVSERIRKMELSGSIEKFTIKINREKQGYHLLAFIMVVIDKTENILPSVPCAALQARPWAAFSADWSAVCL